MESRNKSINVAQLRSVIDSIFAHMEDELRIEHLDLTEDYYWTISDESLYMGELTKEHITVGSLFDDLDFLTPLLHDKSQAFPLMFIHVVPLLRYLAIKAKG